MFKEIFGAVAGPIIGGLFGKDEADNRNEQAAINQQQEYQRQKEFAQMGIRWRVEDAKAAGLHPLAAIGAAGASYSPTVVIPESSGMGSRISEGVDGALKAMGQNTTRAQVATQTVTERRLEELAIRNAELRNSALELELAARTASLLGQPANPPAPSAVGITPAQVGHTLAHRAGVKFEPSKSIAASPANMGLEAASSPFSKRHNLGGRLGVRLPSQEAAEALEGLGAAGHLAGPALLGLSAARELIYGPDNKPHPSLTWNPFSQQWENRPASPTRATGAPRGNRGQSWR